MKGVECLRKIKEFFLITSVTYIVVAGLLFFFTQVKSGDFTTAITITLLLYMAIAIFACIWLYRMDYLKDKTKLYTIVILSGIIGQWLAYLEVRKLIQRRQQGRTENLREK